MPALPARALPSRNRRGTCRARCCTRDCGHERVRTVPARPLWDAQGRKQCGVRRALPHGKVQPCRCAPMLCVPGGAVRPHKWCCGRQAPPLHRPVPCREIWCQGRGAHAISVQTVRARQARSGGSGAMRDVCTGAVCGSTVKIRRCRGHLGICFMPSLSQERR